MNRKLFFICVVLCSLLIAVAGCSITNASAEIQNPTPTQEVMVTVTVTPVSTPTPTATPTLSSTPILEVISADQQLAEAPEISGLTKEIQDGKVIYKAVEGNEYGIEAGEFAGEYNPNISVEGERVGAVALEPGVVTKILNDELDKIPEGEKQMKIVIPLDVTEVTAETGLNIEDTNNLVFSEYLEKESKAMVVEFNNPLTFINPCIEKNQFNTLDQITNELPLQKESGEKITIPVNKAAGLIPFSSKEENNTEAGIENIYYYFNVDNQNKISTFNEDKIYAVGEITDVKVESALLILFDFSGLQDTETDDLLKLADGTVVFTSPQETTVDGGEN